MQIIHRQYQWHVQRMELNLEKFSDTGLTIVIKVSCYVDTVYYTLPSENKPEAEFHFFV